MTPLAPWVTGFVASAWSRIGTLERRVAELADALELEAHAQAAALRSADGAEGIRAFQQKRPPRFTGH